jgi:hypothetical protein
MTKLMNNSHAFSIKRTTSVFVISFLAVLAAVFSPQSAYAEEGESDGMARPELYEQHSELWQKDPVSYTTEEIEEIKRQEAGEGLIGLSIEIGENPDVPYVVGEEVNVPYSTDYGEWIAEDFPIAWEASSSEYEDHERALLFIYANIRGDQEYRYWSTSRINASSDLYENPVLVNIWGLGCITLRARIEGYNYDINGFEPLTEFSNQLQVCVGGQDFNGWFYDIPSSYAFNDHIVSLMQDGIVNGYDNGYFNPNWLVNRAQMSKFIRRAYAFENNTTCGDFPDVPSTHTFYTEIMSLKCAGVISGYEDGTFRPDELVTRGQSMKFIMEGLRSKKDDPDYLKFTDTKYVFNDVNPGDVFYEQIMAGYDSGIVSGYSSEYFGTNWYTSRGAMSKMIDLARSK